MPAAPPNPRLERAFEQILFRSRWLMAPVYAGLLVMLAGVVIVFFKELIHELVQIADLTPDNAIVVALSLVDLCLTGNLILIVVFSGYESFISHMEVLEPEGHPDWMGSITFSELKLKLMASLVAISGVALLRALWKRSHEMGVTDAELGWLLAVHLAFVVSAVLLAVMNWLKSKAEPH